MFVQRAAALPPRTFGIHIVIGIRIADDDAGIIIPLRGAIIIMTQQEARHGPAERIDKRLVIRLRHRSDEARIGGEGRLLLLLLMMMMVGGLFLAAAAATPGGAGSRSGGWWRWISQRWFDWRQRWWRQRSRSVGCCASCPFRPPTSSSSSSS